MSCTTWLWPVYKVETCGCFSTLLSCDLLCWLNIYIYIYIYIYTIVLYHYYPNTTAMTHLKITKLYWSISRPLSLEERPHRKYYSIRVYLISLTSLSILIIFIILTRCEFQIFIPSFRIQCNFLKFKRVGTLIVATIYLQLIQNRYMFRSFNVLQCSHQHCLQPVASDVEVVGYL